MAEEILGTVLMIDDEEDFVKVISWRLQRGGFRVLTANGGRAGLELAQKHTPDVILLDYMMPIMNGYEVLDQLKQDDRTKNIPVIMLTAVGGERQMEDSIVRGAIFHMTKPFDPQEMLREIRLAISKKRATES